MLIVVQNRIPYSNNQPGNKDSVIKNSPFPSIVSCSVHSFLGQSNLWSKNNEKEKIEYTVDILKLSIHVRSQKGETKEKIEINHRSPFLQSTSGAHQMQPNQSYQIVNKRIKPVKAPIAPTFLFRFVETMIFSFSFLAASSKRNWFDSSCQSLH